ncbi:hypothetical protein ACIQWZ_18845 [Streptomyces sp. NPDC098077]|uniref:hypothetical protein n=1 Tax=Streptomyces sp. NPDC098077 TaxID=3366093 RepID=UPI00380C98B3
MYAIREMLPDDQPAAERLWARRVQWARTRGIGPIRITPSAAASTAALPLVLTCDGTVVALATVAFPADLDSDDRTQTPDRDLRLERLVTDPDVSMPEAGSLSWIVTTCISDVAARTGYDWVRMQIAPARLAEHLRAQLAWQLEATVRSEGATIHLLRRPSERSDAVRALVRTQVPPPGSPTEAVSRPGSGRCLPRSLRTLLEGRCDQEVRAGSDGAGAATPPTPGRRV